MEVAQRIAGIFGPQQKGKRLIWNGFKPDGTKNQYWQNQDIDWELHLSGKLKQGGNLSCEGISKAWVIDIDENIDTEKICEDAWLIDNKTYPFKSPSKRWHIWKFWHKDTSTKNIAEDRKKTEKLFKNKKYKIDFGHSLPKENGSLTGINFPFNDHQMPYDPRGNVLTIKQFIHRYRFQNFPLIAAATGLKTNEGGRPKALLKIAALLEQKDMFQYLDDVIENFGDKFDDTEYIERIKLKGIHKPYINIGYKGLSEAISDVVGFEYKLKEPIQDPPPNFFEGAEEFEDYAFNNGSGATGQESRNKNKTKQKIISFKQMAMKEEDFHKKIERTYIVSPLICDVGLYILAGRPKGGKSRILKDLTYKIQNKGLGSWLGHTVVNGDGLLLALEDNEDSMNLDIKDMGYQNKIKPTTFVEESPKLGEGLEESITLWTKEVSNPKLVIIDPFQKVKPLGEQKTRNANAYEIDYHYLSMLHSLARELKICIIYVHHLSQAEKGHSWDKIMGSTGHQGVVDAMYMLEREEGSNKATLKGIGRNIKEFKIDLEWNSNPKQPHTFQYVGDSFKISTQIHKREIYKAMRQLAKDGQCSVKPADVYKVLNYVSNKEKGACNKNMMRMKEKSELLEGDAYGTYKLAYGVEKYDEQGNLNLGGIF
tara:strand:+ start:32 stop:1987 length:1956 start_codon:yes stop_codon:yes gene_type:complete